MAGKRKYGGCGDLGSDGSWGVKAYSHSCVHLSTLSPPLHRKRRPSNSCLGSISVAGGYDDDDFRCSTEVSWNVWGRLLQDLLLGSRYRSCGVIELAVVIEEVKGSPREGYSSQRRPG